MREPSADVIPFLIFQLGESYFTVEATSVLEIALLPEITKLEEVPSYVAGIVRLHRRIVPIVDMNLRFGCLPQAYGLEDCIIFLERDGMTIGIIANQAIVVHGFNQADFVSMSSYGFEVEGAPSHFDPHFIWGVTTWDGRMIMRLQVENLLDLSQSLASRATVGPEPTTDAQVFPTELTSTTRDIFRDRSLKLAKRESVDEEATSAPVAVVRIGAEFFGIALDTIREFAELRNVTPIPCSPDHVVGQMNLRGDLITIADISKALGLQVLGQDCGRKVVVMNNSTLATGVIVDELLGVVYPLCDGSNSAIRATGSFDHEFSIGFLTDGPRTLNLIDLPKFLRQGSLIVNERP